MHLTIKPTNTWLVLIVDDERFIHDNLEMNLRDMVYEEKSLSFLHAYSSEEAQQIIRSNPETAIIILDVMMEEDDAGLNFVKFIREQLHNDVVKILLHTGQPGIAPKREVSSQYLIDGYLDKSTVDNDDCYAAVQLALKAYQEKLELKHNQKKTDETLYAEIANHFIYLLENYVKISFAELQQMLHKMIHLSQQILADYSLTDMKENLLLGTTKSQKLPFHDYSALIEIHNMKLYLSYLDQEEYDIERTAVFDGILKTATNFSRIEILHTSVKNKLQHTLSKTRIN